MANERVPLARLYEKTSAAGRKYFVGRMGGARLLLFHDDKAEGTDPVWQLFAVDAEADRPPAQRPQAKPASGAADTLPGTAAKPRPSRPATKANGQARRPKPTEAAPYERDPNLDDPLPW